MNRISVYHPYLCKLVQLCAITVCIAFTPLKSASAQPSQSVSVGVVVSAIEPETEELLLSYLKRELRSLGDVVIAEEDPTLEINAVTLPLRTGSRKTGEALHVMLKWFPEDGTKREKTFGLVLDGMLYTVPDGELLQYCREIIARFDVQVIDSFRQSKG